MTSVQKHQLEDTESWLLHQERRGQQAEIPAALELAEEANGYLRRSFAGRQLKKGHHLKSHKAEDETDDAFLLEEQRENDFWTEFKEAKKKEKTEILDERSKQQERLQAVYQDPGISPETTHSIMIDAGSTGSRLHVYEWKPRVLSSPEEITRAVAGDKLSFPGTESRWTERLRPGLADFALIEQDDALDAALKEYLRPLLDFAESVLHTKRNDFENFPIYLRATAGMRILETPLRARVMASVRRVLSDTTYNKFQFKRMEQARTLSGEEEAIYDWTGVNFLLGDLVNQSQGAGTVVNPKRTHGALDLGGGSTQISFFEPNEDIMSNLFKLQIGQAKHWNVYAHSFLFYGMNEAIHRHGARLAAGKSSKERIVQGIYDPCMPKGSQLDIRSNIHMNTETKTETWDYGNETFPSGNGFYQATLYNDGTGGYVVSDGAAVTRSNDVDACFNFAKDLLQLEKNAWCNFGHKGDCSFAGVYQPRLPSGSRSESFGEFVAFSNYYHVWKFLDLPERATIQQLYEAARNYCALDLATLMKRDDENKIGPEELPTFCFRSAYVFNMLHQGYGFEMTDTIRVSSVINGQKVGWALGAMLYEINTLPWSYEQPAPQQTPLLPQQPAFPEGTVVLNTGGYYVHFSFMIVFMALIISAMIAALGCVFAFQWRRSVLYQRYEPIKDAETGTELERQRLAYSNKLS